MILPIVRKAFIMASGKSSRFGRKPPAPPKTLCTVGGISLLERNARLIDQAFAPDCIYLVAGSMPELIGKAAKNFSGIQADIRVIQTTPMEVRAGLLGGFSIIAEYVKPDEPFIAALGDEYYQGEDHQAFARALAELNDFSALCAFKASQRPEDCARNYSLAFDKPSRTVANIREKDCSGTGEFFGLGLVAGKGILAHMAREQCLKGQKTSPYELINQLPGPVYGCQFSGDYVNINQSGDLIKARDCYRQKMQAPPSVEVVIPALNEEDCIAQVVTDFKSVCSRVIVMDNMSRDRTAELAKKAGAMVVSRSMGGYGDAIKQGLDLCRADIVAITEADGSFRASDLKKLLPHLSCADAVFGSRTNRALVRPGAFMPYPVRLANRTVGLFLSCLWPLHPAKFTDVGCSLRAMWRDAYLDIQHSLEGQGPEFAPEVGLELMDHGLRITEKPVSYYPRLGGGSKLSGNYRNSARTALRMLKLMISKTAKKLKTSLF